MKNVRSNYFINVLDDFKPEEALVRSSSAAALFRHRTEAFGKDGPITHCLPAGVPAGELLAEPFKIVQTPGLTMMLYEENTTFRQVFTVEVTARLLPDSDLLENFCAENEKDGTHLVGE